jgi:hypothetical protein
MKRKPIPILWMVVAFGIAAVLATAVLARDGANTKGLVLALRLTARWSFLLFWLAYAGGAMAALFGRGFAFLAGRGREFGLGYAAAQLIHIALVIWLFHISLSPPLSGRPFVFFTVAIIWTYLLAIFSFGGLAETLGSTGWQILRIAAVNCILCAFASDFVPIVIDGTAEHHGLQMFLAYTPFAAMTLAAPLLVFTVAVRRWLGMTRRYAGLEALVSIDSRRSQRI